MPMLMATGGSSFSVILLVFLLFFWSATFSPLFYYQGERLCRLMSFSRKVDIRNLLSSRCRDCTWYDRWRWRGRYWLWWKGFIRWGVSITVDYWLLQMEPCGNRCPHIVRCASKLKANKLCDVPERAGYFYDLIAVTSCGLVVRGEEVD